MNYIWLMIKGLFLGITNIIPGMSGGTMAVSLGIYDDLIHALTHLKKEWKASLKVLVPIAVSTVIGIAAFAFIIEWLLEAYTLYTAFAFIGLLLGGLPILIESFKESLEKEQKSMNFIHVLLFIFFFIVVTWMGVTEVSNGGMQSVDLAFRHLIALFGVGLVSAAAMVIPGISGSLLMIIFGYYYVVINSINHFTAALASMDFEALIPVTVLLSAFGLGMLVGIVLISKVIDYLFKNHPGFTYAGIVGLVLASPIPVITNTNAFSDLSSGNTVVMLIIAFIIAAACFLLANSLGRKKDATEELPKESENTI